MPAGLIHGLLFTCRHQFSWPRTDDSGTNYQVCVHCGAKYSYDWETMRRVAPLAGEEDDAAAHKRGSHNRKCGTKRAWQPRERRLQHRVAVQFRTSSKYVWIDGMTENISRSGLLFRSPKAIEAGAAIELDFDMPQEITGEGSARVLCEGKVVRVEAVPLTRSNKQPTFLVACSIKQYNFLPPKESEPTPE
jgi:PilZ domain-containing protein